MTVHFNLAHRHTYIIITDAFITHAHSLVVLNQVPAVMYMQTDIHKFEVVLTVHNG